MGRKSPMQKQFDEQARVLDYIEDKGVASAGDIERHYGSDLPTVYTLKALHQNGRLDRVFIPEKRPRGWRGPRLRNAFYYIPGTEMEVAEIIVGWLPLAQEGDHVTLSHIHQFIGGLPGCIKEHLRTAYDRRVDGQRVFPRWWEDLNSPSSH